MMPWHFCIKVIFLSVVSICVGSALTAQEVRVLSGAHDGFSRLVVYMPSRIPWKMTGEKTEREISFESTALQINTSLVFNRIEGVRLAAVSPLRAAVGLKLSMKCECDVTVFWHGKTMLVIDVADPRSDAPFDVAMASLVEKPVDLAKPTGSSLPYSFPAPVAPSVATKLATEHFNNEVDRSRGVKSMQTDIDHTRRTLAREIARAASLGLISAQEFPVAPKPTDLPRDLTVKMPPLSEAASAQPEINLHALTSADHIVVQQIDGDTQTGGGLPCIAPAAVAIATWGEGVGFASQVGAARTRLIEELNTVTSSAALDLARLYLYFGFGAEAMQVLKLIDVKTTEVEVANAMAQILERGHATTDTLFGQLECDSHVALWSALSYEDLPANTAVDTDAVLRAVSAMPVHLRRILGPQMVRKFTAAGQSTSAERTFRIIDRIPAKPTSDQMLAAAEIEIAMGDPMPSDASLETVVNANTTTSAEALVRRIDSRLKVGGGVPQSMANLAGAYAQEQEGTRNGQELARVFIEATAAAGSFDAAFAEMKRLFSKMPVEKQRHVVNTVLELLVNEADELTFLRYADQFSNLAEVGLPPRLGNKLARRFLNVGFPDLAQPYLRTPASGSDLQNRRLLRAEVDLENGAPHQALVDLLGLDGKDANILRAKAKSQLGEHRAAHQLFLSAGETKSALREALLAEEWKHVEAIADEELVDVVSLGLSDKIGEEPIGALARNRVLLDASAFAREEVKKLLETRVVPPAPVR
ncbi:hypothetical protein OO012_10560 [Rhodobacteraceae bacterium KMM 6894]|nr:hypothetical protein [Rhodobacteraceae bacterium KMM 6894]